MSDQEYIVTARKWRPNSFGEVVGQDHISITLRNAIDNNRIHHAYLFTGPRGVGKTTTARIYAREVVAYGIKVKDGLDVSPEEVSTTDIIEIDGASNNSVEDVRTLRENSQYMPTLGKYKIYIIDEVHMLSTAAFNALLKTLEEPPPHLLFVFATTEPHKLPATITSRCQRFDFKRMSIKDMKAQLEKIAMAEGIKIEDEALISIAKKADGSMRDSQSIFDQVVAFCGMDIKYSEMTDALNLIDEEFYFQISDNVFEQNVGNMFVLTEQLIDKGYDLRDTLAGLLEHFRNILNIKVTKNSKMVDSSDNYIERYRKDGQRFTEKDLIRIMKLIVDGEKDIKISTQPRIRFELLLATLSKLNSTVEIGELISEIKKLKSLPSQNFASDSNPEKKNDEPNLESIQSQVNESRSIYAESSIINKVDEIRKYQTEKALVKTEKAKKPSKSEFNSLSISELSDKWDSFLEKYANSEYGLNLINQIKTEFLKGTIIFHPENEFVSEEINSKKNVLINVLNDYYKTQIIIKIGKPQKAVKSIDEESNSNTISAKNSKKETKNLTDIENYLITAFGAEEELRTS